ncbi:hypothetical protein [Flavobacterium sp.]|uniref:hypothetical protein n=1 Tax=Flavobacterium sp. TaxID=239 RepID=UPI001B7C03B0|nr:hypothetical protein [Flavobacterium sp.]MBP6128295.1 hypothetical protein [Flavobacterium sp.]
MKKIILLFLFSNYIFSQEIPSENYFWQYNYNINNGIEGVIGVKNCYVRQDSTANSQLLDSLQIGHKIKVIKNTNANLNIKGLDLSWVEIEYIKNSQIKTGFLWKGFIAVGSTTKGNNTFLTTINSKYRKKIQEKDIEYDAEFYRISVKAIDNKNEIISEKSIDKQLSESVFFENSIVDSWGLKNITEVYRISFSGQACGIPTFHYYFGWTGTSFLLLPEKYNVGDAGVFYHNEEFVFPKEKGGQPNIIIKNITEAENTDDTLEKYTFLVTKLMEYYSWDGKKFKLIKTKKRKPYTEIEN